MKRSKKLLTSLADNSEYPLTGKTMNGMPMIWVRITGRNRGYPGTIDVEFDCPCCGQIHQHGLWDENFGPSPRASHCPNFHRDYYIVADPAYLPGGPLDYQKCKRSRKEKKGQCN
jgi:hypothetical protein